MQEQGAKRVYPNLQLDPGSLFIFAISQVTKEKYTQTYEIPIHLRK